VASFHQSPQREPRFPKRPSRFEQRIAAASQSDSGLSDFGLRRPLNDCSWSDSGLSGFDSIAVRLIENSEIHQRSIVDSSIDSDSSVVALIVQGECSATLRARWWVPPFV